MRAREYDPNTGRFLEIDPLEAAAGDASVGVYVYVDDRPTVETDPSGEYIVHDPNACTLGINVTEYTNHYIVVTNQISVNNTPTSNIKIALIYYHKFHWMIYAVF